MIKREMTRGDWANLKIRNEEENWVELLIKEDPSDEGTETYSKILNNSVSKLMAIMKYRRILRSEGVGQGISLEDLQSNIDNHDKLHELLQRLFLEYIPKKQFEYFIKIAIEKHKDLNIAVSKIYELHKTDKGRRFLNTVMVMRDKEQEEKEEENMGKVIQFKETDLLESKNTRENFISRVEVLEKVGELLLLSNTEYATVEQVADYYEVSIETINKLATRNKDELESDGYQGFRKSNVIELLNGHDVHLEGSVGKSIVTFKDGNKLDIPNRGLRLFPKRAILRVGMLLRDSEIAKEIRTRLLDIVHDAEQGKTEIIQNITEEITEEKQLILEKVEAEYNGDYDKVSIITAKLFAIKNKRIEELENINEQITTNALTITESRAVINRLIRSIAIKEYSSRFSIAWGELYSKLNYKLGINIKARNKKKNESYINTLTEEETFETEKIVRSWAVELGLDLDSLLKIS